MINESVCKDTLVPLILRGALAVIFIYNGLTKIVGAGNEWGAAWAIQMWTHEGSPPAGLLDTLDTLPGEKSDEVAILKEKLKVAYGQKVGNLPETLGFAAVQLAVAWGELLSGACLLLGLLTRLSAVAMIVVQLGAIWTVTLTRGFAVTSGGYEYNLALVATCLAVLLAGGGTLSIDRCWAAWRRQPAAHHPAVAA